MPAADSITVPLSAIQSIEERRFSAGKTVFLVLGLGATALLVVTFFAGLSFSRGWWATSRPLISSWDGPGAAPQGYANFCTRWLLESTTKIPPRLSTATPMGQSNWPSPPPWLPQVVSQAPPGENFCTR
jgi:hypothetical protein